MKTFKVDVAYTISGYTTVYVEADTVDEAYNQAEMDEGEEQCYVHVREGNGSMQIDCEDCNEVIK